MHQDHNIPWKTLATHFLIAPRSDPRYTNKPLNFYPRERPDQARIFTHFSHVLIKTIHEFATTERQKYPPTLLVEKTGDLFTDEDIQTFQKKYNSHSQNDCLNKNNQKVEYWIGRGTDLGLASAVSALLIENQMSVVLTLACHPSIPLATLYRPYPPEHCRNPGWNVLPEYALHAYVFINILAEFPEYCQGRKYKGLSCYRDIMNKLSRHRFHSVEEAFHCRFLDPLGDEGRRGLEGYWYTHEDEEFGNFFEDMGRLKEYLKACFAVMYRSEVLARECGITIPWEMHVATILKWLNVRLDCRWVRGDLEEKWEPGNKKGGGKWVIEYI
ncbi:hypothetical protein BC939DRAFT_439228 [Gamsiella multidivaricata]|uniref:uncharacterized protein n=1 Tax=Gamsiella multidivaricata TaxID=101098 RepID=UPI002220B775|nr:uncharacterized protein BC939DRAFT_439228 [Gamsiella multidivaricata]KAI7830398.1 hypothetical protein BC939DRAFT_439228 [Gamsiella multidivaricata]